MYSDINHQILSFFRFSLAFFIVFIFWPRILFKEPGSGLDAMFSRYVKMTGLIIAAGYVLVVIKLYELMSLVALLGILTVRYNLLNNQSIEKKERWVDIGAKVYDFVDGLVHPSRIAIHYWQKHVYTITELIHRNRSLNAVKTLLLLFGVFLYSAYLRFYDAFMHAAPAMSDAYVTLAWMKYIEKKILFHDGIYPQGFHIYLSVIHKFAGQDPLYVLKYAGPLNSLITAVGIYFVVSRMTGHRLPGILSMFVYGVLGGFLPMEWDRQASTNSQEFALIFLLPGWYFVHSYLTAVRKSDFWAAAACFLVIGWVHTIVFVFLVTGVTLLIATHLALNIKETWSPSKEIFLAGVTSGLLSGLPLLFGLLMGQHFHSSSVDFINRDLHIGFPSISGMDQLALGGILTYFIVRVFTKRTKKELVLPIFLLLLGAIAFFMHMTLGPWTGKAVFVARSSLLWSLVASLSVGFGWHAISMLFPGRKKELIGSIFLATIFIVSVFYLKPDPIQPYKMQYNSMVEQYLRISTDFRPTEWMIVTQEEGYALALGRGWHLMLGDFLRWYNPESNRLVRNVDGQLEVLTTQDIFLFKEKKLHQVELKEMVPILQRRKKEYQMLDQWIEKYRSNHNNISIYYEDSDIQVLRIHQPRSREEVLEQIWGIKDGYE